MVVLGAIVGAVGTVFAGPVALVAANYAQYAKSVSGLLAWSAAGSAAGSAARSAAGFAAGSCTVRPFPCAASGPFAGTSALFYPAKYRLKCWKASDDTPTTFCRGLGQLFFSKVLFKWKDRVPGQ